MSRRTLEAIVAELLEENAWDDDDNRITNVQTFRDAGVLSIDPGLLVGFDDGREYQVTILQTGWTDDPAELEE